MSAVVVTILCVYRYRIRGDDNEWDQVLKNAGNTAIVSIKRCSDIQDFFSNNVGFCGNTFVMMFYSQQWQEEKAGWGKRYTKQWDFWARETKKEGNATRQIQEEQGQAQQIWKEVFTVNVAALTEQCVDTEQEHHSLQCKELWIQWTASQILKSIQIPGYLLRFSFF